MYISELLSSPPLLQYLHPLFPTPNVIPTGDAGRVVGAGVGLVVGLGVGSGVGFVVGGGVGFRVGVGVGADAREPKLPLSTPSIN